MKPPTVTIGIATARWPHRLASRDTCSGPRRCHDGCCSFGGGDVSVHRCGGFDPSVGGDADAMRAALAAHDEVLHRAIEAHDGFLFSHTGDGVVAAFASPRSAVDAAVAAQRALELPVRMGVATGEAELRDGDYFGTVLNRAARVMAAGHGGQVLVADSTAVLLSGAELLDLGPRRLREGPMPIGVSQLQAEGLRTECPPLRALDTSPGNLGPASTSLSG